MVKDITIGQYVPGTSFLHRLDSRVKTILVICFITVAFFAFNFISLALVFASVISLMAISGVSISLYFKNLKMILFIIIFTAILNLFYGNGDVIFQWKFMTITSQGIQNSIFIATRIIALIFISCVFTFTTSPNDLTFAIESLLKPLKKIKVPVSDIAMMMTIALRFVPTIMEETEKIINAQKARGADIESGNMMQRIKALIPILVPLFVSSFRRAYDLAIAMDCRCYQSGKDRSRMKTAKLHLLDFYFILATLLVIVGVVLCNLIAV